MAIDSCTTTSPQQPLCIADLCQAIANGQIVPVVRNGCYQISSQDLCKLSQAEEQDAVTDTSIFLGAMASRLDQSEVSCLT